MEHYVSLYWIFPKEVKYVSNYYGSQLYYCSSMPMSVYCLLFQDSLGGNAKTYIIANVHPGSKCFGETLSTLHFAQRAKLIKNKVLSSIKP